MTSLSLHYHHTQPWEQRALLTPIAASIGYSYFATGEGQMFVIGNSPDDCFSWNPLVAAQDAIDLQVRYGIILFPATRDDLTVVAKITGIDEEHRITLVLDLS